MSEGNRRKKPMSIEGLMHLMFPQAAGEVFKHGMSIGEQIPGKASRAKYSTVLPYGREDIVPICPRSPRNGGFR